MKLRKILVGGFLCCSIVAISNSNVAAETTQAQSKQAETKTQTPDSSWKTYSNPDFHLSFSYPSDWNVKVSTAKPEFIILLLFQGAAKSAGDEDLKIEAYKNSKPEDENIDQDAGGVKSNAQLTLGQTTWKVFNEPLQAKVNTIPLYFLRKVQNTILYMVGAINVTKLNPIQTQIVSSFKLN